MEIDQSAAGQSLASPLGEVPRSGNRGAFAVLAADQSFLEASS
jgi:hypothetical protein